MKTNTKKSRKELTEPLQFACATQERLMSRRDFATFYRVVAVGATTFVKVLKKSDQARNRDRYRNESAETVAVTESSG